MRVSVILPCLNEVEGLKACLPKIERTLAEAGVIGEIIVCDNGSSDGSGAVAAQLGAWVVHQPRQGYGYACQRGFAEAQGDYLIMGDADDTYDFRMLTDFLSKLDEGYDFVTGSRYQRAKGIGIPFWHRYLGNPVLTGLVNRLFGTHYTDVYCGLRAFTRKAYDQIRPVSCGMEFNLELAINAGLAQLKITELPIQLRPRQGISKLNTLRDGWRSLRLILLYCPNQVFLWPGGLLLLTGSCCHGFTILLSTSLPLLGIFATIFCVVGCQVCALGLHAKTYSWSRRFDHNNVHLQTFYRTFKLEHGLILGLVLGLMGVTTLLYSVIAGSVTLVPWACLGATLTMMGVEIIFTTVFISAMAIAYTQ